MNIANLANLFHQNAILQPSKPLGQALSQPPITDTLHRLSENFLTAQEQFLQEGAKELNRVGSEAPGLSDTARQIAGGDQEDSPADLRWSIDTSAKDICAEIDRALASAHKVTSLCRNGASAVLAELKRRGRADQPYHQLRFDEQDGSVERASMFQDIYTGIWDMLRQGNTIDQ